MALSDLADNIQAKTETTMPLVGDAPLKRLKKLHHDNVSKTGDEWSNVQGTVFEVSDEELARADSFEAQYLFKRMSVPLASGKDAWVYVHDQGA